MAEVTIMVLKVDLSCCKCYKKVKKVLCKFPEIRDQVYDEKQNNVTIKVASCCPEKIRQKIWCKGGKSNKSIEIEPPKKEKKEKKAPEKKQEEEKKATKKKQEEEKKGPEKKKDEEKADKQIQVAIGLPLIPKPPSKPPAPAPCYPPWYGYPIPSGVCCRDCYEGRGGGPCQRLGYVCRYPCYCGCYGRPVFDSCGGYYRGRCEIYCDENPSACSVM